MRTSTRKITPMRVQGFSLIELLVVLVILGLLAGMVVPNIMGKAEKAKSDAARTAVQQLSMFVENYYLDNGSPPDNLEALVRQPGNADNWSGPYAKESQLKDPWGRPYQYRYPGEHGDFDIFSLGADDSIGGEGPNKDVGNWQ
ncbi:MAG: type II secretion system protein GspG [Lysobacteraceae bacterium]|nr:MAG: type II secretion system protein GspG [Xanthomonadaceae bacterium]